MKTNPNDSVSQMFLRQTGENEFRAATPKELQQGDYISHHRGLTKREHFASMVLVGLLSDTARTGSFEDYAKDAVKFANALIEELNKQKP